MFKKILFLSCLFAFVASAKADTIYTLTLDGCTGTCGTDVPFATIDVAQTTANELTITETLGPGEDFIRTGAGDSLEFNLSISTFTIGNITTGFSNNGADSASTFGSFLESLACTGCGPGGSSPLPGPLSFTISATGITAADFIVNSHGNYFASDIMGNNGKTGNVGGDTPGAPSPTTPVPEPSSMLLFGTGALALAGALRRRI